MLMKVLVTGAEGFIGSQVVAALTRHGADPVGLTHRGAGLRDAADIELIGADYRDRDAMEDIFGAVSPTALVHSAWRLAPGSGYLCDPANIAELEASLRLFALARRQGCVRIVGIGTCLEYEASDGPTPEETPLRPATVYGASKAALFIAASGWAPTVGVSFAWPRLYYPFGPGEAPQRLVPAVVNAILRGERVATTPGLQRRSFLFVEDVADAIAAITLSGAEGAFNVGSLDTLSVRELVERIAGIVGRPDLLDIGALEARVGDPDVLWPDTTRLRTVVGWHPSIALDDALERTIAWWRTRPVSPP
jgi:nucleoside-diphosphate-sugar epimerase